MRTQENIFILFKNATSAGPNLGGHGPRPMAANLGGGKCCNYFKCRYQQKKIGTRKKITNEKRRQNLSYPESLSIVISNLFVFWWYKRQRLSFALLRERPNTQFGLERNGAESNDNEDLRWKGEALGASVSMKHILAPARLHECFTHCVKRSTVSSAAVGVKVTVPTRLHEYFTHCVKNSAVSSGRRETHSAYKTAWILHALRQTQCGWRGGGN